MTVPQLSANPYVSPREAYILAFDILASCGFVFLGVILVTAMASKGTRRRGTWYSLIIAWMTYSAAYLLILGQQTGPEPVFGLCTLQAALIYGTPALNAYTHFCFVLDTYLAIRGLIFNKKQSSAALTNFLVTLPWAIAVLNLMLSLSLVKDSSNIERDTLSHMYCHINTGVPAYTTAILCLIPLIIAIPLEGWAAYVMYKHWRVFRHAMANNKETDLSISLLVRFAIFTAVPITGISLTAAASGRGAGAADPIWATLLPTLPVLAAIAFGTQRDIMFAWISFGRKHRSVLPTSKRSDGFARLHSSSKPESLWRPQLDLRRLMMHIRPERKQVDRDSLFIFESPLAPDQALIQKEF